MTKEQVREAAAVMLAWADGNQVEYSLRGHDTWEPNEAPCWSWAGCDYRIKPTLRPWTADEVPLGAWMRYKGNRQSIRILIVGNMERGLAGYNTHWPYQSLLDEMEHSTDGGKTWLPCGVMEWRQ